MWGSLVEEIGHSLQVITNALSTLPEHLGDRDARDAAAQVVTTETAFLRGVAGNLMRASYVDERQDLEIFDALTGILAYSQRIPRDLNGDESIEGSGQIIEAATLDVMEMVNRRLRARRLYRRDFDEWRTPS